MEHGVVWLRLVLLEVPVPLGQSFEPAELDVDSHLGGRTVLEERAAFEPEDGLAALLGQPLIEDVGEGNLGFRLYGQLQEVEVDPGVKEPEDALAGAQLVIPLNRGGEASEVHHFLRNFAEQRPEVPVNDADL